MKKSTFAKEQIVGILREKTDRDLMATVAKRHGVREQDHALSRDAVHDHPKGWV